MPAKTSPPDFPMQFRQMWETAGKSTNSTTICHYLSQFFIKRWAVSDVLRVEELATGVITNYSIKSPISIAFENNLYTTYDGTKEDSHTLESFLSQMESEMAPVLKVLANSSWVISLKQREIIAKFTAAMILRLPTALCAVQQDMQSECEKIMPNAVQKTGNTAHALFKVLLPELTQQLYENQRWTIICYPECERQKTADIPLILATHNGQPVSTDPKSWEILFPLDPHALLVINGQSDPTTPLPTGVQSGLKPMQWNAPGAKWRIH